MSSRFDLRRAWRASLPAALAVAALATSPAAANGPGAHAASYLGTRVTIKDAPWVATLADLDDHYRPRRGGQSGPRDWDAGCSAVVIGPQLVVTATHCVDSYDVGHNAVRVGADDLSQDVAGRVVRIARVWSPQYRFSGGLRFGIDVALIETKAPLGVPAVPIADTRPQPGEPLYSLGFGGTKKVDDSAGSPFLHRLDVALDPTCGNGVVKDSRAICGQAPNGGALRGGDSGGPLVVVRGGVPQLVGIASATDANGGGHLDTYGNVVEERSWIAAPPDADRVPIVVQPTKITGDLRPGGRVKCEIKLDPKPPILTYSWYLGSPLGKRIFIPGVSRPTYGSRGPDSRKQTFAIPRNAAGKRLSCSPIVKTKGPFLMSKIGLTIPHIPRH